MSFYILHPTPPLLQVELNCGFLEFSVPDLSASGDWRC